MGVGVGRRSTQKQIKERKECWVIPYPAGCPISRDWQLQKQRALLGQGAELESQRALQGVKSSAFPLDN